MAIIPGNSSGSSGGFGLLVIVSFGTDCFFADGFSSMNLFNPFSPPGKPPVNPISSFSKASSGTLDFSKLPEFSSLPAVDDACSSMFLFSSCCTPFSPLQSPLPPRISKRSSLAHVLSFSLWSLGIKEYGLWGWLKQLFWPRKLDLSRVLRRVIEEAIVWCSISRQPCRKKGESLHF